MFANKMSFKVLELFCKMLGALVYPSLHFMLTLILAPVHPYESLFDSISCELISGELVNEQAYGDITFGYALSVNALTPKHERK